MVDNEKIIADLSPLDVRKCMGRSIGDGHCGSGPGSQCRWLKWSDSAVGKLVLFSKTPGLLLGEAALKEGKSNKIAIANPATAPYGAAGVEVMKALGVYEAVQPKIVQGINIAQTFQFIDTGNAEVGFIALSQVVSV